MIGQVRVVLALSSWEEFTSLVAGMKFAAHLLYCALNNLGQHFQSNAKKRSNWATLLSELQCYSYSRAYTVPRSPQYVRKNLRRMLRHSLYLRFSLY